MQVLIRIKEPRGQFFQRMAEVLSAMPGLEVKSDTNLGSAAAGNPNLGFRPIGGGSSTNYGCNFIVWPKNQIRLLVTPLSDSADSELDEQIFCKLFAEPLRQFNRRYSTRYRLSFKRNQPRLTPSLEKAFDSFVTLANMKALHPYDWERFYSFVALSYSRQPDLDENDVRYFLKQSGFGEDQCAYLSDVFRHCKEFYIHTDPDRRSAWRKRSNRS